MRFSGRWTNAGIDAAIVAAITAFAATVSQSWPGFNSPDSEFYASLALHGAQVVDRAIEPAYIWTRLGYIAPVRGLVSTFGPWVGFEIWRVFLLLITVASVYAMAHVAGRPRALGAALALFTGMNTVVLSYVGNTYLSGTAMAGTFLVIALGVWSLGSTAARGGGLFGGPRWVAGGLTGAVLGWILMTNPYPAILAGTTWLGLRLVVLARLRDRRRSRLALDLTSTTVGFCLSVAAFLIAGRALFPGRNWVATYLEWNRRLDYTVFIGDPTTWRRDTGLLVLIVALAAALAAVVLLPARRWAWAALAVSVSTVVTTILMMVILTGPWLESPTYVALLFPGALSALALVVIAVTPGTRDVIQVPTWVFITAGIITTAVSLWFGRYEGVIGVLRGWLLAGVMLAVMICAALVARSERSSRTLLSVAVSVALVATYGGAQLLQNGRGILGVYGQYPFAGAYLDFDGREQMEAKIAVQEWLLGRTASDDSIVIWTDTDGLGASTAAMQMWGGDNLVTLGPALDRATTERLEQIRPSVVAMYAPEPSQIEVFYASLPPWSLPSPLDCTAVPFPVVQSGRMHACITRLTWVG